MNSAGGLNLPPPEAWGAALQQLELQLDRGNFNTWLRGTVLLRVEDASAGSAKIFVIGAKNDIARAMLESRLYRNIRRVMADVCGEPVELRFEVSRAAAPRTPSMTDMPLFRLLGEEQETPPPVFAAAHAADAADHGGADRRPLHQQIARPQRPDLPESHLNPRFTLGRFVAGPENTFAYNAACAVFETPDQTYNPLFIHGTVGTGKTHLMHAIAHECQARGRRALFIPAEVFINDMIEALRQKSMAMFRDRYRTVDVLLVDDIQFLANKEAIQEEFFHTFNTLHAFNKQIVLTSDRSPHELTTLADRLRSRFSGGLIADIQPPGFETRLAILHNWSAERGVYVQREVLTALAERATYTVRHLEGAFNNIVAAARLGGSPLDAQAALGIMADQQRPREGGVTVRRVLEVVAGHFHLACTDLIGPRRTERVSDARQIAMYLARQLTTASLPQIGDAFGGRKHSTVAHACKMVSGMVGHDPIITAIVSDISQQLTGVADAHIRHGGGK